MKLMLKFALFCLLSGFIQPSLQAAEEISGTAPDSVDGGQAAATDSQRGGDQPVDGEPVAGQAGELDPEEESPSRFIPTEQISQDLGVSFPADI